MISICIPAYNCEKTITPCLESVLSQKNCEFEIIIVNDGSSDKTKEICEAYKNKYENIILYSQDNQGQISSRQQCVRMAHGEYSVFLDADDELCPGALESLLHHINEYHSDVYFFDWRRDSLVGQIVKAPFLDQGPISKAEVIDTFSKTGIINAMWSHVVKTSVLMKSQVFGFGDLRFGEDAVQSSEIFANATSFYYINTALYIYKFNNAGVTHTLDISKRYFDLEYLRQYLNTYFLRVAEKYQIITVDKMAQLYFNLDIQFLKNLVNLYWQCCKHLSENNRKWMRYFSKSPLFRSAFHLSACFRLPVHYLLSVLFIKLKMITFPSYIYRLLSNLKRGSEYKTR